MIAAACRSHPRLPLTPTLAPTRAATRQAELEIVPFNVRLIARSLRKQYGILLAKLGGVEMRTRVGPDVAQVLLGDPARINQILLNFLSNAVKFTQQGSITLSIQVSDEDPGTQTLSFSVQDTGVGIRKEDQAKLFQSYSQATSHTSRQFGGTGLGLAICKVRSGDTLPVHSGCVSLADRASVAVAGVHRR